MNGKPKSRRMSRVAALGIASMALAFVAIQWVPVHRESAGETRPILDASGDPGAILARSCMDCHSGETRWPWYASVAPASWLVAEHVRHGRDHMDFSNWASYPINRRIDLFEDICEEAENETMPLQSYLLMHRKARLSRPDTEVLCRWSREEVARLRSLPIDSASASLRPLR